MAQLPDSFFVSLKAFLLSFLDWTKKEQAKQTMPSAQPPPEPTELKWDTRENARHSVRVICDQEGLSPGQKNLMSSVIHCESGYDVNCVHPNKSPTTGKVMSTDYGICQWNDYYHGKEISPDEALHNPEKAVRLMCHYVLMGRINQWVCFSKSLYRQYSA